MKGLTTPFSCCVQVFVSLCRCIYWGLACASYWIDTLVLNRGKYLSLICCITLSSSREKSTQAQEVAGRISGAVAGEVLHQAYQVPIINSHLLHYIIYHLPLVFLSPTSKTFSEQHKKICLFIRPSSVRIFVCFLFGRVLVGLLAFMAQPKNFDPYYRKLEEIENNTRSFMSLQFEHNSFSRNELKEQKTFMEYMNKELDDMSKEFYGLKSQFAHLENLVGQISDKQTTLVNKMAAKLEFCENNDEDLKVIDVTPIESLFSNINLDKDGTGDESTLVKRRPNDSEFIDLDAKIDKSGIGEVKTLSSNEPTLLDFKEFNYDNFSLIDCISLLQSMLNSPHAYNQNKAFTKHITDAMMKSFEEKLELEVSIARKLYDEWEPTIKIKIKDYECYALCDLGASVSRIPKTLCDLLGFREFDYCSLNLHLADSTIKKPMGRINDVLIVANRNYVPVDFIVLYIDCNPTCPIILGRPFLIMIGAIFDMKEVNIRFQFPLRKGMEHFPRNKIKLPYES